jgi:hypothetical protein
LILPKFVHSSSITTVHIGFVPPLVVIYGGVVGHGLEIETQTLESNFGSPTCGHAQLMKARALAEGSFRRSDHIVGVDGILPKVDPKVRFLSTLDPNEIPIPLPPYRLDKPTVP